MEVRNLIFNRSTVNVKKGNSFICFNLSKIFTFLTVMCGCSYWGCYIHSTEASRFLWSVTHVQKRETGSYGCECVAITSSDVTSGWEKFDWPQDRHWQTSLESDRYWCVLSPMFWQSMWNHWLQLSHNIPLCLHVTSWLHCPQGYRNGDAMIGTGISFYVRTLS